MTKMSVVAALVAVLVLPGLAEATTAKHHKRVAQRAQPQIACTVIGCVPVPRGCGQAPGKTWDGLPTGNDIILCPPGVAPFR